MHLLTPNDVPPVEGARVFRYSRTRALAGIVLGVAVAAGLVLLGARQHAWLPRYLAGVVVVTLLFVRRAVVARFQPSNWLIQLGNDGLFVQLRSHLNHHFPAGDRTVVFVSFREIESARLVIEDRELPDTESRNSRQVYVQRRRLLELELRGDTTSLAAALAAERARPAPREETWYGGGGTKYNHFPVTLSSPSCLRIEWRVVPPASVLLDALRAHTTVENPVRHSRDFARLETLGREEQEARLRELAVSGHVMEAIKIARRLYGLDLRAAKEYVEAALGRNG